MRWQRPIFCARADRVSPVKRPRAFRPGGPLSRRLAAPEADPSPDRDQTETHLYVRNCSDRPPPPAERSAERSAERPAPPVLARHAEAPRPPGALLRRDLDGADVPL